jgi:glycyl-tRNA synthetase
MTNVNIYDKILEIAKRRGFFWPSFEIYGGLSGFVTFGDLGTKLKRNIKNVWREHFVRHQGFLELDTPIINSAKVFEASGHLEHFKEYSVECTKCGRSFRADHLIEEKTGFSNVEAMGGDAIRRLLVEHRVKCPACDGTIREPVMFLTMFQTNIGVTGGEVGYARPETAQGMFLNFKQGFQHAREKLPFALAQVGNVLRNEVSPRRGLLRLREFTLMELEFFFDPKQPSCPWFSEVSGEMVKLLTEEMEADGEETALELSIEEAVNSGHILTEWQAYFMGVSKNFISCLGVPSERQRFRAHLPEERSHYSAQTFDHEVDFESWGWTEVAGHAYRTDYDLKAHQQATGADMTVLRSDGARVIPHVVEPSFGLSRLFYIVLEFAYRRRKRRNILVIPRSLVPLHIAVFPLVTKDGLPEKAVDVHGLLLDAGLIATYDDSGSIGRRYARSDEAGTPLAITIDYQTLEDNTVTIRDRDSWGQVRQEVPELPELLRLYFREEKDFADLGSVV